MNRVHGPIEAYLEYLLLLIVTLECNSMFTNAAQTAGSTSVFTVFYGLALLIALGLVASTLVRERGRLRRLVPGAAVPAALLAFAALFYLLGAGRMDAAARRNYLLNFPLLLPLLTALFWVKRRQGRPFELFYRHSDVVCALAALGLAVWMASVIRPESMPSDVIYSRWNGRITAQANLLDVCQFVTGSNWQVFGIALLRNKGLYAEPLMFALQLVLALFTELFLRPRADGWRPFRWALLSAALVTVNATIGLMLLALAWGLKGVSACLDSGKRRLIIPIALAALCALGVLYLEKDKLSFQDTEVSGSSLGVHLDDYRVALRAFKDAPLTGNGYLNEAALRGYMSDWRLRENPGLSNTAGVILAEGGLMLEALCLIPFGIALMYLFKRRERRLALWALGPLAALFGIIFRYRMLLMLLMAFGYSLLEVEAAGGGFRLALAQVRVPTEACPRRELRRRAGIAVALTAVAVALAALGGPLWQGLHGFLRGRQFSVGQSPLRAFCFASALLLNGVLVQRAARKALSWRRLAALVIWDGIYLWVYGALRAWIGTQIELLGVGSELPECLLLLLIYFAGAAGVLFASPKGLLSRRGAAALLGAVALLGLGWLGGEGLMARSMARTEALAPALEALAEQAEGPVYVDELPALYRRRVKGLSLPATRQSGYDVCESATVVFPRGTDSRELLDAGFQLAALGEEALVYTNDPGVIAAMAAAGETLYRYYPFEKPVALSDLAAQNGLELTAEGGLIADGPEASLNVGPGDTLYKGSYTARYALRVDPDEYAGKKSKTTVCRLIVSRDSGGRVLKEKKVALSRFDESGRAVVDVRFGMGAASDGVEFLLAAEEGCRVEVQSIDLLETPEHITVNTYNCHRDVVRAEYYTLEGAPFVQKKGYAALERDYDAADRVKAERFFDADGQPALYKGEYFEVRYAYNRQGKCTRKAYYGPDGAPICRKNGCAALENDYDAYGNVCEQRYYDTQGQLTLSRSGYAIVRRAYNGKKQVTREEYFGPDGERVACAEGYAALEMEYDGDGQLTLTRYFDVQGNPVREEKSKKS